MRFPMTAVSVLAMAGGMFLGAGVAHAQTTWYVDGDGDVAGDCTSWADACPELQAALTLANPNDQIWVAVGIYKPDYDIIDGQHTGNRTATFQLINGVAIYGGFNGTETTLEDHAGLFDQTILSGDLNGDDEPDDFPFGPSYSENSYHVVAGGGTDRTAILDGFTITAGNANALPFPNESGGGMFNDGGSPTVSNCTFAGNFASYGGGMANIFGSSATVTNCTFSGNGAHFGGGMTNSSGSTPTVTNCTFSENWAGLYGGGMANESGSPTVTNCTFSGNMSYHWGGGMSNREGSNSTVTNCTFSGNSVFVAGGGMYNYNNSSPTVSNCILWYNGYPQIEDGFGASTTVRYSDVQGGWPGEGNIDADPLFVDAASGDLHLSTDSPCIDAADNTAVPADTADLDEDGNTDEPIPVDLDDNPRFVDDLGTPDTGNPDGVNPIVDMGAYEFQGVELVLDLDIKPGSCPNPFNRHGNGVLPVALVGSGDFDPMQVDLSTLQLSRADGIGGSVGPNEGPPGPHSGFEDVASPFEGAACECHDLGGDGIDDLSMKFRTDEVVEALELDALPGGAAVELVLSGNLLDGTPFAARDCIVILPPGDVSQANAHVESNVADTFVEVVPLDLNFDDDGFADFSRSYYSGTAMTLTAPPQSAGRRFVRWLIDGAPQPIGMRTVEVIVSADTTLKAVYARPARATPERPTESDGPLE